MSNSGIFLANSGLSRKALNQLIARLYTFGKIIAFILVVALLAKFVFVIVKPMPESSSTPETQASPANLTTDLSVLETFDLFSKAEVSVSIEEEAPLFAIESTLDLGVTGVLRLPNGRGSAIMRTAEGDIRTFVTGDEIEDGVILERIERDRVIISRAGVLESIRVEAEQGRTSASSALGQNLIQISRLSEIIILRPVRNSDGTRSGRYTVMSGRDIQAFAATGMKDGDVIEEINGVTAPRDPNRLLDIFGQMQPRDTLALVVNRQGERVYLSIEVQGAV